MPLIPLYGHAAVRQRLAEAAQRGSLPSSLLLHGPKGVGKQRLALWLGQLLLCSEPTPPCGRCQSCRYSLALTHPDLHWFFPRPRPRDADPSLEEVRADYAGAIAERAADGGLYQAPSGSDAIYVATTRAMLRIAAMSPAIGARKVFVIGDADRMVPQEGAEAAANAFLKLLEEPPADTTIVLTSSVPGVLLPTIRSRVVALRVPHLGDDAVRAFLADPLARAALTAHGWSRNAEDAVALAGGAPGTLLGTADASGSSERARRILAAAKSPDGRTDRLELSLSAGASKARSTFTETLDALVAALHREARDSVEAEAPQSALAASLAVEAVDRARTRAWANVNPQLITASLFDDLSRIFHG